MKLLMLLAMLLQSTPSANSQATASIEGIVVDRQMLPVAGAEVIAFWEPPPMAYQSSQLPRTNTDASGKFIIRNLAPGGYRVTVSATGYASQIYGKKTAGNTGPASGTVLTLGAGQSVGEITVILTTASTISGRVVSSNGEPLTGINVNAVRAAYDSSGIKSFVSASGGTQTDDRGEYRIAGVAPGSYYLRAATPGYSVPNELLQMVGRSPVSSGAFGAMYFPGVNDVSGASLLEVREGENVRGIIFTLPRLPTFKIRGHVLDANGLPPKRPMMGVTPIQSDFFSGSSMSVSPFCGSTPNCENKDGAFEMTGVAPGYYWVKAQISASLTPEQRALMEKPGGDPSLLPQPQVALTAVRVTNADVDGVELKFYPKLTLSGRVLIDDSPLLQLSNSESIKISLRPSIGTTLGPVQNVVLDAAGRFTSASLIPAEYRVDLRGLPQGFFLDDIRLGDRDVSTEIIPILAPQSDQMNIRLSAKSGRVYGVVVDSISKPVANAAVVLVPVNESHRPDRYKTTIARSDGRFEIEGIAPGDYTAFSWETLEDYSWFDPNVVRQFEGKGKPVRVVVGSNQELQVAQISAISN